MLMNFFCAIFSGSSSLTYLCFYFSIAVLTYGIFIVSGGGEVGGLGNREGERRGK